MCLGAASGAADPGALMSQQRKPEMKVEMVMTPEGCRRQTSKNSRDSSAFIAYLPTPLFSLYFFFFQEGDCVLIHLLLHRVPILLPSVSFLYARGNNLNEREVQLRSLVLVCTCVRE